MIYNGIEYGLMQAYAEGFDILRGAGADIVGGNNCRWPSFLSSILNRNTNSSVCTHGEPTKPRLVALVYFGAQETRDPKLETRNCSLFTATLLTLRQVGDMIATLLDSPLPIASASATCKCWFRRRLCLLRASTASQHAVPPFIT
jgi:hypothetical protein